jgi:electron transfer flavoprotein alpha subunit
MAILVIAEHDQAGLKVSALATIAAAKQLKSDLTVLLVGYQCQAAAEQAAKIAGVSKVLIIDELIYKHPLAETLASLIQPLAADYSHILAPATSYGKNFMPRLAALLRVEQISDICAILDDRTFKRPIYAGNAIATIQCSAAIKLITIRSTCFAITQETQQAAPIQSYRTKFEEPKVEFIQFVANSSSRPELAGARVVIAGGRGLQNAENFKLLESLADKLGAAVGATRAAVDAGFAPNDYQVGQTGKVVAPDLYIAIGISGAIQHIAGMKDSKIVVAINKDPDAPIFKVADYGLVGDLFTLLPELEQALEDSNK